jgi:hypothetical protein
MLVHQFYLKETVGETTWDIKQTINMMNTTYSAKMDQFFGSYGKKEEGFLFTPVLGNGVTRIKDSFKGTYDTMYRGMIMKHRDERVLSYVAYSFIDLVSASGGIIKGLQAVFTPIAAMFSILSFDLSILSLLFLARSADFSDFNDLNGKVK